MCVYKFCTYLLIEVTVQINVVVGCSITFINDLKTFTGFGTLSWAHLSTTSKSKRLEPRFFTLVSAVSQRENEPKSFFPASLELASQIRFCI